FVRAEYSAGRQFHANIRYRGTVVGGTGVRFSRPNAKAEIGYWLSADAVGHGIVTRSTKALTTAAFADLGLRRVSIRAAVDNVRSRAVPERLGFGYEGVLRANEVVGGR